MPAPPQQDKTDELLFLLLLPEEIIGVFEASKFSHSIRTKLRELPYSSLFGV